jgi:hypothetical protein
MIDEPARQLFSRSSIGRNRLFWVVVEDWGSDPIVHRIARSPEEALAEAERQCGPVIQRNATLAKGCWTKQRAINRQRSVANSDDALSLQFAYRCYWYYSEYDGSQREVFEPHRIVKKTKSRLYVEADEYDDRGPSSGEWWDYDHSTCVVDRRKFETSGKADRSSKGWWDICTYYADPSIFHAERGKSTRPAYFEELDLPVDATIAQIKSVFRRLSRSTYPNAGGTDYDFVRLRKSYEEALKIAASRC